jgi:hypothetical protein
MEAGLAAIAPILNVLHSVLVIGDRKSQFQAAIWIAENTVAAA